MKNYRHIYQRLKETKVFQNFSYMSVLSISSAVIGLIIYSYLIRVLGAENMGKYAFFWGISGYFQDLMNYGFQMPAVRAVALNRNKPSELNKVVSLVYTCKAIALGCTVLITVPFLLFIPVLKGNMILFIVIYIQSLHSVIFPDWYYQGMKKMKYATILQLTVRLLQIPLVLWLLHDEKDLMPYAIIVSSTMIIGGLVGFFNLHAEGRCWVAVRYRDVFQLFWDSTFFFLTNLASTVKEKTITTLIGTYMGMKDVAVYDLAMKIILIPRLILKNINGALFPEVVKNITLERLKRVVNIERRIGLAVVAGMAILCYPAVILLGGQGMADAYPVAFVLSTTIYSFLIAGAYLNLYFVPKGKYKLVTYNQFLATVSCIVLAILGMHLKQSALMMSVALSLSGVVEVIFCKIQAKRI